MCNYKATNEYNRWECICGVNTVLIYVNKVMRAVQNNRSRLIMPDQGAIGFAIDMRV